MNRTVCHLTMLALLATAATPLGSAEEFNGICALKGELTEPLDGLPVQYKFSLDGDKGVLNWVPSTDSHYGTWFFSGACGLVEYLQQYIDYLECKAANPTWDCPMPPIIEEP